MTLRTKLDRKLRCVHWDQHARQAEYHPGLLAAMCGISVRQLERYCKSDLRTTPSVWLHRRRMTAAKRLLRDSTSVKEVAYSVGFKNPNHFSREFKRYYGVCPTQYLIRHLREELPVPG